MVDPHSPRPLVFTALPPSNACIFDNCSSPFIPPHLTQSPHPSVHLLCTPAPVHLLLLIPTCSLDCDSSWMKYHPPPYPPLSTPTQVTACTCSLDSPSTPPSTHTQLHAPAAWRAPG